MKAQSTDVATIPASDAPAPADGQAADQAPAIEVAPHSSAAIVETWFSTHFHNMGAQLDGRVYALLHAAKEDLKSRLVTQ